MPRRARCNSKWNKILIVDDDGVEMESFQLGELGQHVNKIKTQNRRRIHEGRRARKVPDQPKALPPNTSGDEATNSQTFAECNSNLQNSSEVNNLLYNLTFSELNEEADLSQQIFLPTPDNMFDILDFHIDF